MNRTNSNQYIISNSNNGNITYNVTEDGIYDLFAVVKEKNDDKQVNITSYISDGTEYKIGDSVVKLLDA